MAVLEIKCQTLPKMTIFQQNATEKRIYVSDFELMSSFGIKIFFNELQTSSVTRLPNPGAGLYVKLKFPKSTVTFTQYPLGSSVCEEPYFQFTVKNENFRCEALITDEIFEECNEDLTTAEFFEILCELPERAGPSLHDSMMLH